MITEVFKGCTRSTGWHFGPLLEDVTPSLDDPFPRSHFHFDNKITCPRSWCTVPRVIRVAALTPRHCCRMLTAFPFVAMRRRDAVN